jgi:hypothetical protein
VKRRLRGHHLVCLHFYEGKGYSADFIENLNHLLRDVVSEGAIVVSGADDVCAACPHFSDSTCRLYETSDKEVNDMDGLALSLLNVSVGQGINWLEIKEGLHQIIHKWHERCCVSCLWFNLCGVKAFRG